MRPCCGLYFHNELRRTRLIGRIGICRIYGDRILEFVKPAVVEDEVSYEHATFHNSTLNRFAEAFVRLYQGRIYTSILVSVARMWLSHRQHFADAECVLLVWPSTQLMKLSARRCHLERRVDCHCLLESMWDFRQQAAALVSAGSCLFCLLHLLVVC